MSASLLADALRYAVPVTAQSITCAHVEMALLFAPAVAANLELRDTLVEACEDIARGRMTNPVALAVSAVNAMIEIRREILAAG